LVRSGRRPASRSRSWLRDWKLFRALQCPIALTATPQSSDMRHSQSSTSLRSARQCVMSPSAVEHHQLDKGNSGNQLRNMLKRRWGSAKSIESTERFIESICLSNQPSWLNAMSNLFGCIVSLLPCPSNQPNQHAWLSNQKMYMLYASLLNQHFYWINWQHMSLLYASLLNPHVSIESTHLLNQLCLSNQPSLLNATGTGWSISPYNIESITQHDGKQEQRADWLSRYQACFSSTSAIDTELHNWKHAEQWKSNQCI